MNECDILTLLVVVHVEDLGSKYKSNVGIFWIFLMHAETGKLIGGKPALYFVAVLPKVAAKQ